MNTHSFSHTTPTRINPLRGRQFVDVAPVGRSWEVRSASGSTRHATHAEAIRSARTHTPAGVPIYVQEVSTHA